MELLLPTMELLLPECLRPHKVAARGERTRLAANGNVI